MAMSPYERNILERDVKLQKETNKIILKSLYKYFKKAIDIIFSNGYKDILSL